MNNGKIEKPVRPKVSLGCERFEDRSTQLGGSTTTPHGGTVTLAETGTIAQLERRTVHAVGFTDATLTTATDGQLLAGTTLVAIPAGIALFEACQIILRFFLIKNESVRCCPYKKRSDIEPPNSMFVCFRADFA